MTTSASTAPPVALDDSALATDAALNCSRLLGINQRTLGRILGEDPARISRFKRGTAHLRMGSKCWESALLFIRLFRSLDAIMGSDDAASKSWMNTYNEHLNVIPLELVQTTPGLVNVVDYLDSFRAKI